MSGYLSCIVSTIFSVSDTERGYVNSAKMHIGLGQLSTIYLRTLKTHIRFARQVQNYGDAFSKSSSIHDLSHILDPINTEWSLTGKCICILEIRCRSSTVAELSKLAYIED